jgi:hypothetical protein
MVNDWIRTLTIIGEGRSVDDALDLIAKVNQPGRQAGVNLLVEQVLIQWLVEATGRAGARLCSGWRRRSTRRCHLNSRRDL